MTRYINTNDLPLSILVPLIRDDYEYNHDENHLSATEIIKPIKKLVLQQRVEFTHDIVDVNRLIPIFMGLAMHKYIDLCWNNPDKELKSLLNTSDLNAIKNSVSTEKRSSREINGFTISGQYDFVLNGVVQDIKTTSVYNYINQTNAENYKLQGSIYRWLNPELITKDYITIIYIFTDYSNAESRRNHKYPNNKIIAKNYPLLSIQETEEYIVNKINQYKKYKNAEEDIIPPCTDKDLWRAKPVYKYYRNANNFTRSTKNFASLSEASHFKQQKGVGIVKEVKGKVKACEYCDAFTICSQKDQYF